MVEAEEKRETLVAIQIAVEKDQRKVREGAKRKRRRLQREYQMKVLAPNRRVGLYLKLQYLRVKTIVMEVGPI